jgi:hypothetical protein
VEDHSALDINLAGDPSGHAAFDVHECLAATVEIRMSERIPDLKDDLV